MQLIRTYAPMVVLILMSAFVVALCMDEYVDQKRAAQDILIEVCAEVEADDYEWDEADEFSGTYNNVQGNDVRCANIVLASDIQRLNATSLISDEHKLGLVRRYAPRKALQSYNYILINREMV